MSNKMKHKVKLFSSVFIIFVISIYIGFNLPGKTAEADTIKEEILVYKSPTCGCCKKWVKHLKGEGFKVTTKDYRNMKPIKNMIGVQAQFQSCHTAKVGKYFIEGHVSASDIKRLLKEKPDIKGLSVPGMPMGSPGMEGHRKDKYDVIAIDNNNNATVYSKH
ncbi:MAG: DUF411 domain-containing protein [Gammaproteobacteria bacterium]|nr:DUF411 domain-containing protein [Gammaproteobacteria bacterium]